HQCGSEPSTPEPRAPGSHRGERGERRERTDIQRWEKPCSTASKDLPRPGHHNPVRPCRPEGVGNEEFQKPPWRNDETKSFRKLHPADGAGGFGNPIRRRDDLWEGEKNGKRTSQNERCNRRRPGLPLFLGKYPKHANDQRENNPEGVTGQKIHSDEQR